MRTSLPLIIYIERIIYKLLLIKITKYYEDNNNQYTGIQYFGLEFIMNNLFEKLIHIFEIKNFNRNEIELKKCIVKLACINNLKGY